MNTPKRPTGPRTPEGKRRSSLNALKHGLTATSPQALEHLAEQLRVDSQAILARVRDHYRPKDPIEEELVNRIAVCLARLQRSKAMEDRVVSRNPGQFKPGASCEGILRYERSVDIHLHRAITTLTRKRAMESK